MSATTTSCASITAQVTVEPPKGSGSGGAKSVEVDLDLTLTGVNEEQTISAPANSKPLSDLFVKLGVNPIELLGLLGGGSGRRPAGSKRRRLSAGGRRRLGQRPTSASRACRRRLQKCATPVAAFLRTPYGWPYLLTPLIPLAVALDLAGASAGLVFATSALGIVPTAALMGRATEELAARSGPGIGGLLNVTFGNAPELIIALFALGQGLHEVVKASIVGSIIGNILLVLGAAMLAGGLGREKQTFSRTSASVQTSMLLLAAAALLMPAIFELVEGKGLPLAGRARSSTTARPSSTSRWPSRSS